MFKILATAAALSLAVFSADAATITSADPTGDLTTLSLTSTAHPGTFSSLPGSPDTVAGSSDGLYRSPFEGLGAGNYEDIEYFNVVTGNTATLSLGSIHTGLSLLWGSVDDYNTLALINSFTSDVLLVTSLQLINPDAPPSQVLASFVTVSGFAFDTVEFRSTQNSFEFSNISAAVPLPAGGLLLLGALGALAAAKRRRLS